MSRWFRHYAGMMRDDKLVRVAIKTKQPIERVLWVWGAILESAAEIDTIGKYDFDPSEAAYFLRVKPATISTILAALKEAGHIDGEFICKWKNRQFQSDKSKDRVAAHRAKKRSCNVTGVVEGNGGVTLQGRYCNAPDTETETDSSVTNVTGAAAPSDKVFWDGAVTFLGGNGKRALIGKWCRDHGKDATAKAITAAQLERAVDPVAYITAALVKSKQGAGYDQIVC